MASRSRGKFIRRTVTAGLAAVLLMFFVYAFLPKPLPVDMATVSREAMQVQVSDEGYTRVRDVYVLSAPVSGRLLRIEAQVGDEVVAGETLLTTLLPGDPAFLDSRSRNQAEATVRSAEAALALARAERRKAAAQLEFADVEAVRARQLESKNGISRSELDRAELALKTARAALDTAGAAARMRAAELQNAQALLVTPGDGDGADAAVRMIAPVNGRILRLLQESETVVAPGTPLIELGDPENMEVVVDLLSRDAVRVSKDAAVTITGWGGDDALNARVSRIEPYGFTKVSALGIEEQRVNIIIDITDPYPRWSGLGHGYRVDAAITLWRGDDILQLPAAALFRQAGNWAVFRVSEDRAELAPVTIGQNNGRMAQVLKGIEAGDTVILHPSERITDGTRVIRREF